MKRSGKRPFPGVFDEVQDLKDHVSNSKTTEFYHCRVSKLGFITVKCRSRDRNKGVFDWIMDSPSRLLFDNIIIYFRLCCKIQPDTMPTSDN